MIAGTLPGAGAGPGVRWVFTDRHGGTGRAPYDTANLAAHVGDDPATVLANRLRLAARLELPPQRLRFMHQVHGDRVEVLGPDATAPAADPAEPVAAVHGADAMVTAQPGLALAALVADCVPVLLADAEAGVVAAVHCGRPGVRAEVALRALDAMVLLGADPARTIALLGPSVCALDYEVPELMRADVAAVVPEAWATSRSGTPALDLRAGLAAGLSARGVTVEQVGPCTVESADHFSYRRDGTTGRCAGIVWVQP